LGQIGSLATNLAVQVVVGLPYSRSMETEADRIGVELAARAGYDPRAAITLWQKMGQVSGGGGPAFLSTHPQAANRVQDLQKYSAAVMPLYNASPRR
jgi:predicted Zn-dependent protease